MIFNIPTLGLQQAIIVFIILILSISIHEFTHAYIAHLLGDETARLNGRLTLNPAAHFEPFGFLMMLFTNFGWGKPVPVNPYNMQNPKQGNLLVAIGGPVSNLLVAFGAALFIRILLIFLPSTPFSSYLAFIFTWFIIINVGLAIFNLLPIPPLDGSNIYRPFLPLSWQYRLQGISLQAMLILFVLAFLPVFNGQSIISLVITPIISTISSILIP